MIAWGKARPAVQSTLVFGLASLLLAMVITGAIMLDMLPIVVLGLLALSVGLGLVYLVLRRPFWGALALIWLVPLHSLVLAVLVSAGSIPEMAISAFKLWKVGVLFILLLRLWLPRRRRYQFTWFDIALALFFGMEALYLLLPVGDSSLSLKLFAIQFDSLFLLFYLLGRLLPLSYRQFRVVVMSFLVLGWAAALFAILEIAVFPDWLLRLSPYFAYLGKDASQRLPTQFYSYVGGVWVQRPGSFYLNPIEFSFAALIPLGLSWGLGLYNAFRPARRLWLGLLLLVVAVALALSRSVMLGVVAGFAFVLILRPRMPRWFLLAGGGLVILAAVLMAALRLDQLLVDTIRVTEPSAEGHLTRWGLSLEAMRQEPFGMGLGASGPVARRFLGAEAVVNESWYFQIATEMGVVAGMLFVGMILLLIWQSIRVWQIMPDRFLRGAVLGFVASSVALATASLFLHSWGYDAVAFPFWLLSGLIMQLPARVRMEGWLPEGGT